MWFSLTIVCFIISFFLAAGLIPVIINISQKIGLFEKRDERKTHEGSISNLGGVGIVIAFALPILTFTKFSDLSQLAPLALAVPLLIISLLDDLKGISITFRFIIQAMLGLILFEMGFQVIDLEGQWILNLGATVFFTMLLINAFNFIDGINGLAGGLGVIASIVLSALLVQRGQSILAMACLAYGGALTGFLVHNFGKKSRIFMGDNGSTVLGFMMAFMVMAVLKNSPLEEAASWPIIFSVVAVPVVDVFKVFLFRLLSLKSPFNPDRSHIHHLLVDDLLSHPTAAVVIQFWTVSLVCLAYWYPNLFTLTWYVAAATVPYVLAKTIRFLHNKLTTGSAAALRPEQPVSRSLQAN